MKNFQPGGLRGRKPDLGGRPQSDVNSYAPKFRSNTERSDSKPRFNASNDRSDRAVKKDVQLFTATCTTCGKSCEVPFRPDGTKPVLCRDCFAAKNASPSAMTAHHDRFMHKGIHQQVPAQRTEVTRDFAIVAKQYDALVRQLGVVETKVNQILELISISEKLISALPLPTINKISDSEEIPVSVPKVRKPKKVVTKKVTKKVAAKSKKQTKK